MRLEYKKSQGEQRVRHILVIKLTNKVYLVITRYNIAATCFGPSWFIMKEYQEQVECYMRTIGVCQNNQKCKAIPLQARCGPEDG